MSRLLPARSGGQGWSGGSRLPAARLLPAHVEVSSASGWGLPRSWRGGAGGVGPSWGSVVACCSPCPLLFPLVPLSPVSLLSQRLPLPLSPPPVTTEPYRGAQPRPPRGHSPRPQPRGGAQGQATPPPLASQRSSPGLCLPSGTHAPSGTPPGPPSPQGTLPCCWGGILTPEAAWSLRWGHDTPPGVLSPLLCFAGGRCPQAQAAPAAVRKGLRSHGRGDTGQEEWRGDKLRSVTTLPWCSSPPALPPPHLGVCVGVPQPWGLDPTSR